MERTILLPAKLIMRSPPGRPRCALRTQQRIARYVSHHFVQKLADARAQRASQNGPAPASCHQDAHTPKPIDPTHVTLWPELAALTQRLSKNAHELWAQQRTKYGWTWGPKRDDAAKKHPCLVSYSQLFESEKEYDRSATMGTLKAIAALGFGISAPIKSVTSSA